MAIDNRTFKTGRKSHFRVVFLFILLFSLAVLSACSSSSDTRTEAKAAAEAGTYNVVAKITTPPDGSEIAFNSAGTTNTTFLVVATGGSGTYSSYTVNVKGPTTSSTSSGTSGTITITFFEPGEHTLTATVADSTGKTGTDSVKVNVVVPSTTLTTLRAYIVSPIITTYDVNTTIGFKGNAENGSGTYSSYAFTVTGPADTVPTSRADTTFTSGVTNTESIQFVQAGTYVVTFTVKDDLGAQATDTITITIE